MAIGSIEIKQVQRTMNNCAVAEAEQMLVIGRYVNLPPAQSMGATHYTVQYTAEFC